MKTPAPPIALGPELRIVQIMTRLRATLPSHPLVRETNQYANASSYRLFKDGVQLFAILEAEEHDDGNVWLHLSVSAQKPARIPTWKELSWAKDYFLGDRRAIQVLPPKSEYVNLHPHVLNLYACEGESRLPDFRMRDGVTGQVGV